MTLKREMLENPADLKIIIQDCGDYPSIRPRVWVAIIAAFVAAVLLFNRLGAYEATEAATLKHRVAEQSALLKLKRPLRMASEQAVLASVWATVSDERVQEGSK
jgi:hypothetical protein